MSIFLRALYTLIFVYSISSCGVSAGEFTMDNPKYGIYGSKWAPWVLENSDRVSLYIYQMPLIPTDKNRVDVNQLLRSDIDMFFVQSIYESRKERWMRPGARKDKDANVLGRQFSKVYTDFPFADEGKVNISLDEENFWWGERGDYLNNLYRLTKKGSSNVKVWQFFAEGLRMQNRQDREDRFSLLADGYIFDEYKMSVDDYESLLMEYVDQGKPVISILWASSNWRPGGRKIRKLTAEWWNTTGWRLFYGKTMVNRKHGVDTAYFVYDIGDESTKGRLVPGYLSKDKCSRDFVDKLFNRTLPKLFSLPVQNSVPKTRPGWVAERCPEK